MKPLKFRSDDKAFNSLADKLARAERQRKRAREQEEEGELLLTVSEVERICAALRGSRCKERYGLGPGGELGYEDWRDDITDFEIDYSCGKLKVKDQKILTPEQRYQLAKSRGYSKGHEDACNNSGLGCVPTCRFYPERGVITDEECLAEGEERKRIRDSTSREWKRAERARNTNRVFNYDEDTPYDGANSNPRVNEIVQALIRNEIRKRSKRRIE